MTFPVNRGCAGNCTHIPFPSSARKTYAQID